MTTAWTKCSDSLPETDVLVTVRTEDGEVLTAYHCIGAWWEPGETVDDQVLAVTHWAHPDEQRGS